MNNTATNDTTGDRIQTKPSNDGYRSGWDRVFGEGKQCTKCKKVKVLDEYAKDKHRADGLSCACKECRNKKGAEYRKGEGGSKLIKQTQAWFKCSSCLAAIGLGHKKASQVLNLKIGQVSVAWKRGGVTANTPKCGTWKIYASRARKGHNADTGKTRSDVLYEQARMADINKAHSKGFTWAYEWAKELAKRKYHSMSPEEKKAHNRRCAEMQRIKRESDPEIRDREREYGRQWKLNNKDKCIESSKRFRENNPGYTYKRSKQRMKDDPVYKAVQNLRRRLRDLIKTTRVGGSARASELLGCSTKEFNNHLESKFTKGMTWGNYGTHWHVDHILPCSSFDHEDPEQVKRCWHWSNMQPLEAKANMAKSDTITDGQMHMLIDYA